VLHDDDRHVLGAWPGRSLPSMFARIASVFHSGKLAAGK